MSPVATSQEGSKDFTAPIIEKMKDLSTTEKKPEDNVEGEGDDDEDGEEDDGEGGEDGVAAGTGGEICFASGLDLSVSHQGLSLLSPVQTERKRKRKRSVSFLW